MNQTLIRPIQSGDIQKVANIIRAVMPEFGASGSGFAIHDKEVDNMYAAYSRPRCAYVVCEVNGVLVGGGGIAPLDGGDRNTCELKKMYFLTSGRGKGLGRKVLQECLKAAREEGFHYCYLETFNTMKEAMKLYEKSGFMKIPGPLGRTGHFACDTFYQLDLSQFLVAEAP